MTTTGTIGVSRARAILAAVMIVVAGCSSSTPTPTPQPSATPSSASTTPSGTLPVGGGGPSNGPTTTGAASGSPAPSGSGTSPSGGPSGSPTATASPLPPIAGLESLMGTDGRLTLLMLGSDARPGLAGRRTDAIMVVSIDPSTGKVTEISLPRDVEGIPTGPGRVYHEKVTGLYQSYLLAGANDTQAAEKTRAAFSYAFGTEIDHWMFIGFEGVKKLVDAVGGVDVTLAAPLNDDFILVRPGVHGLHLKKGVNHLDGATALLFARTRHADNDYRRDSRQQQLIVAALKAVLARGVDNIPALIGLITDGAFTTDVPLTDAPALFELLRRADLKTVRAGVLGPKKYASAGAVRYSTVMKVSAVRALFDQWLKPIPQP